MAIIDIPPTLLQECTFSLDEGTVSTPFGRGSAFNVTSVSDPVWRVNVQTIELGRVKSGQWSAWKASLRGGINRFRAFDVSRSAPLAYRSAVSPDDISMGWSGYATVTSVGASGALVLGGVPAGYIATPGDRVGLIQSGRYGYYEVLAGAIASGAGVLTLSVAPFLHTAYFTSAASARLWRPQAIFIIDHKTWSSSSLANPTPASFEGYQVLASDTDAPTPDLLDFTDPGNSQYLPLLAEMSL